MAFIILHVFLLGVIAATADDVPVRWSSATQRSIVRCKVADADHIQTRKPPPPLSSEGADSPRSSPYQWWKRNDDDTIIQLQSNNDGSLTVEPGPGAEGVYQCSVSHNGGRVLGYPVNLKHAHLESKFKTHPLNNNIQRGQPVALFCCIDSAPPASISWQRDNVYLSENDRYHMLNNLLIISDVRELDTGDYRCVATNNYTKNYPVYSNFGRITVEPEAVLPEPTFLHFDFENNITAIRGSRVVLPCPVRGYPRVKLKWMLTSPYGRPSELMDEEEFLVLHRLVPDLEGVYTCEIEGSSHLKKVFHVSMVEPPEITLPPVYRVSPRASTVRFNCTATGFPDPKITWYKDGRLLDMSGRSKVYNATLKDGSGVKQFVISGLTSSDRGVYQCVAHNSAGMTSRWAALQVLGEAAPAPGEVRCLPVSASEVLVHWASTNNTAYSVLVTPSYREYPSLTNQQQLQVTEPLTPYTFQVRSFSVNINLKNTASDYSNGVICQGQGVPISINRFVNGSVLVSWEKFAYENPGVLEWILQYKADDSVVETNIPLPGNESSYMLHADNHATKMQVRLLGTRTKEWLPQDLSNVSWTDIPTDDSVGGPEDIVIDNLEATDIGANYVKLSWRCVLAEQFPGRYSFKICTTTANKGVNTTWVNTTCFYSSEQMARVDELRADSQYEVTVRARRGSRAQGVASRLRLRTKPTSSTAHTNS